MRVIDEYLAGGDWSPSATESWIDVIDPRTEQVIGRVPEGARADVDAVVASARAGFDGWSQTDPVERAGVLRAWHARLTARADELAELVAAELGAPEVIAARVHVGLPLTTLAEAADLAESFEFEQHVGGSLVRLRPVGAVAAITPWNYPLHQAIAKVAPALAAGCSVVLKPSELAPLAVHEAVVEAERAGVPAGALSLVHGSGAVVGAALAGSGPDLVSFTGSVSAGRAVAAAAGAVGSRVLLELGGKSANVVLPDVSESLLARAVRTGVARCLLNSGQTCNAWSRLLVPRDRLAEALAVAAAEADAQVPGERIGPMVSAEHRDRVLGFIRRAVADGARVVAGGTDPIPGDPPGYWVRPTVLADVDPQSEIAQEEVFGPVLVVLPYDDEGDALALAEGTRYGLAAGVWSEDLDHAVAFARHLRVGQVDVNGARFNPHAPFGGFKDSGFGRELGVHGLREYLATQSLQL